jgi:tetratricopeptide (TPR) repeat protein
VTGGRIDVSIEHLLAQAVERFANQDYYGAVHLLDEIASGGHRFADVHHLLGLCHSFLGHHEQALREFDQALALNGRYIEAHIHRGIVLSEMGRAEDAEAAFRQAAREDQVTVAGFSRHVAARLANQHAALGEAYAEAGGRDDAVIQLRRAVELGPGFHDLRYRLARLLLEQGRSLEARDHLERIVEEKPDFVDARAALGLAHYLAGDPAGARALWRECLRRRPGHAQVTAYLSIAGWVE